MNKYPSIWDLAAIVGVFLGVTLLTGVGAGAVILLTGLSMNAILPVIYAIPMAVTIGGVLWFRKLRGAGKLQLNFRVSKGWFPLLLWSIVLVFCVSVVMEPLQELIPEESYKNLFGMLQPGWRTILCTVVLAPVFEELLFRGMIQGPATERYGPWGGILIASAIFGIIHLSFIQLLPAFVIGIIMGYVYHVSRSLTLVVVIHALNNLASYLTMPEGGGKPEALREMVASEPLYWSIYGMACALVVLGGVSMYENLKKKPKAA